MEKGNPQKKSQEEIIFNSVPAMIWFKDTENRFLRVNRAAAESTGLPIHEIEGRSAYDIYPKDAKKYHDDDLSVIHSGKPKLGIVEQMQTESGDRRWVRTDKIPYRDEENKIIGVIVFALDITDQKKAEHLLARQKEDLMRSNHDLEQFAYVASHDLKEPLRSVSNYLQLLESKYAGSIEAEGKRMIERAVAGAKRMSTLIEDLLQYSRVGLTHEGAVKVSSDAVLSHALENLRPMIEDSNAQVTRDVLPSVVCVESELIQIFQNLIGNAIKFSRDKKPEVHISCRESEEECVFSVSDNGIGIEKEFFDKIFMIFNRLHGWTKYEGNGIGLSICKKIVEARGGKIWLESVPNHGTSFYFSIPRVQNSGA